MGGNLRAVVKSREDSPPFYLLTGWAGEIPADDPRRELVDAVVAKPVDPRILDGLLAAQKSELSGARNRYKRAARSKARFP